MGCPSLEEPKNAIDTTMVSALRGDETARPHEARRSAVALGRLTQTAHAQNSLEIARKGQTYRHCGRGWCGRRSDETLMFLKLVANAKSRSAPVPLRGKARAAWFSRWSPILSCAGAEVLGDSRYAWRLAGGVMLVAILIHNFPFTPPRPPSPSFPSPSSTQKKRALLRSQGGSGAGAALQTCPTCLLTRIDAAVFRVLLLRRLRLPFTVVRALLPVWPSTRFSWSPPSSLREGRGLRKTRVLRGKCSSKGHVAKEERESQPM